MLHQPHVCPTPIPFDLPHGCIWRCDDDGEAPAGFEGCGRVWRLAAPGNPRYTYWYRLGRFGRWRHRKLIAAKAKES